MKLIQNTLSVGATKPFTFLHVSDLHLAESDENDSPERRAFADSRKKHFLFYTEALSFLKDYVKRTGYPVVNTGDLLDFITPESMRVAKELIEQTDMLYVAGNHEFWHCYKNRFHFDDSVEAYAEKRQSLAEIERVLGRNIRFSRREINGVNLVCMDNGNYNIDRELFEQLKAVEAEGKPILLFMHIPLYSEGLGKDAKYGLGLPDSYLDALTPPERRERESDALTHEICDHIRRSPLIRYVFSGHIHHNVEILGQGEQDQIVTGLNTLREITVL